MYKPFLEKFKSKNEIDQAIEKFKLIKSKDYSVVKSAYFELFPVYPIPAIPIEIEILEKNLSVYRTRPFSPDINVFLKQAFSYPKISDYTDIQRANWKGRNVFYASDSFYTSLSETKLMYNESEFFVSKWGFDFSEIDLKQIQIVPLAFVQLSENNPWKNILNAEINLRKHLLKYNSKDDTELIYYFFLKIGELFSSPNENSYNLSAFLADQILYKVNSRSKETLYFPILIYPSVTNNYNSCNFAISPLFVDKYMKLEKVFRIKLTDVFDDRLKFSYNQIGIEKSPINLEWYRMDHEREKSYYQFNSISCQCGEIFNINDIENFVFKREEKEFSHGEIMSELTKEIDLIESLEKNIVIEDKEIIGGLMADFKYTTDDIQIEINGVNHSNLLFEFKFITPFLFEKIDAI